ncbi:MAG: gamma-glutamyltransferase [Bacteroidales bacterium]|nr:gamma-glutamyltransferase [Bacteroidales bacterium]MCF8457673.1 gamma-glutamyltransferase [Bacteroidales bacterium]
MRSTSIIFIFMFLYSCTANTDRSTNINSENLNLAQHGMVSSADSLASQVGVDILKKGGNAFDAAVAVHFALAVVYPMAGNIGGGGFAVYRTKGGETGSLDFREKAPLAANRNMYLDTAMQAIDGLSTKGHLSVGVPGSVDGMIRLHEKLGSMPFADLMVPAIFLAREGFPLNNREAEYLNLYREKFLELNDSTIPFINHTPWQAGDTIKIPALAGTLGRILQYGRNGFYSGPTAHYMLEEIKKGLGIMAQEDLDMYKSKWRDPVEGTYRGHKIISMPPPSSGGVALLQLLKGSEAYDFKAMGHNSVAAIHTMTELERRVYADRATFLGDPDFYPVPVEKLLDAAYISERNSTILPDRKTNSQDIKEGHVDIIESTETTHFSIVDKEGNAIAVTTTLNSLYGSKVFVEKGGFFLNNEMDDFSIKPGLPNQFGLIGGEANAIEPEKRMLSSMSPTIVEKDGELLMVLGSPGGSTIITTVYQVILNVIDYEMGMQAALDAKRTHHQWQPDKIFYETDCLDSLSIESLKNLGHVLEIESKLGRVHAILVREDGMLEGGADLRGDGAAIGY